MDAENLRELAEAAEKVAPGQWRPCKHTDFIWADHSDLGPWTPLQCRGWGFLTGTGQALGLDNATAMQMQNAIRDYAAAANPAVILSLLNRIDAQERREKALVEALDPDTLEAVADEIGADFKHSARAGSLRVLARNAREAKESAQ